MFFSCGDRYVVGRGSHLVVSDRELDSEVRLAASALMGQERIEGVDLDHVIQLKVEIEWIFPLSCCDLVED